MRYTALSVAVLIGIGLVSCTENEQPAKPAARVSLRDLQQGGVVTYSPNMAQPGVPDQMAMTNQPRLPANSPTDLSGLTLNTRPQAEKPPVEPTIQIPADARWTLYCMSLTGPDRFARIGQFKSSLIAQTGMKDWYVVHGDQESTLFYGFYSAVEKTERNSAKAHADQKRIQDIKTDLGDRLFARCFFTPIVEPDPVSPPEWKLTNAPAKAFWSVEIAAFKDNPLRKQAAVEMVREMRTKGIEAYFYHGQSISSVCVGAWPREAIVQQDDDKGRTIRPEDDVLVSPVALPQQLQKAKLTSRDGHKIVSYTEQIEIADPSLKAAMAQYPEHYVNYDLYKSKIRTTDGSNKYVPSPSLLVKIPGVEVGGLTANDPAPALNQISAPLPPPPTDTTYQPGTGRLRGLGKN